MEPFLLVASESRATIACIKGAIFMKLGLAPATNRIFIVVGGSETVVPFAILSSRPSPLPPHRNQSDARMTIMPSIRPALFQDILKVLDDILQGSLRREYRRPIFGSPIHPDFLIHVIHA